MRDLLLLLVIIGFFAVAVLYLRACAAIAGDLAPEGQATTEPSEPGTLGESDA